MKVLLDTCAFIWLAMPQRMLSSKATQVINDPANELFLSDLSVWEIVMKYSAGKLPLPDKPRNWVAQQIAFFRITPLKIEDTDIYLSGELPRVHADPFDRLLAAQSIEHKMTILSPDKLLSLLGATRVW